MKLVQLNPSVQKPPDSKLTLSTLCTRFRLGFGRFGRHIFESLRLKWTSLHRATLYFLRLFVIYILRQVYDNCLGECCRAVFVQLYGLSIGTRLSRWWLNYHIYVWIYPLKYQNVPSWWKIVDESHPWIIKYWGFGLEAKPECLWSTINCLFV